jgi:DNA-binding transcriptional MerR regulator
MASYTIRDLEQLSGIKAHTLRIWEQRYHLLKPARSYTNIRYYTGEELKKVLNIALLNRYGYKISHIDRMQDAEINERILSLNQVEARQEKILHDLIKFMVDLDMQAFEEAIDQQIRARGIEKAIHQCIFPFLQKIGILWQTNHIQPGQEHLVSNIIRQKLIVGIENADPFRKSEKSVVMFLPEAEYHELGLLFMHYIFKSRGLKVWYLGAGTPVSDLVYLRNQKNPDLIYCHLSTGGGNFNLEKYLNLLTPQLSNTPLIISGYLAQGYRKKTEPSVKLVKSMAEMMDFVAEL